MIAEINFFREKIGRFVLIANLLIFITIFLLFFFNGFTLNELKELMKLLIPIKTVYITAIVKYILKNKESKDTKDETEKNPETQTKLSSLYKTVTYFIVYGQISLLVTMIVLCSLNVISFELLTYFISLLETIFGVYIGLIIIDLFKVKEEEK